jgi:hypothetical protein
MAASGTFVHLRYSVDDVVGIHSRKTAPEMLKCGELAG